MYWNKVLSVCLAILVAANLSAQQQIVNRFKPRPSFPEVQFNPSQRQLFGLDKANYLAWENDYSKFILPNNEERLVPVKSIRSDKGDWVIASIRPNRDFELDSLKFLIDYDSTLLSYQQKNDTAVRLFLPDRRTENSYFVHALYAGKLVGKLKVVLYEPDTLQLCVVPLTPISWKRDSLEAYINDVFKPALISWKISIAPLFIPEDFKETREFDSPSSRFDHYTNQMRTLRDLYFENNPAADRKSFYLFLIPAFKNGIDNGFIVHNKALGFIPLSNPNPFRAIARTLSRGLGFLNEDDLRKFNLEGETLNLMDSTGGTELTYPQWELLRHNSGSYSYFDAEEDVKTNNGLIAYYFWEEDANGYIIPEDGSFLRAIKRPYKKNYLSYHLNIYDLLYKPLFFIDQYLICMWHFILLLTLFFTAFTLNYFARKKWGATLKISPIWMTVYRWGVNLSCFVLIIPGFLLIEHQVKQYEVESGLIEDFVDLSYADIQQAMLSNKSLERTNQEEEGSEILLKRGNHWYMKRRKKVLYFDVKMDSTGNWSLCKFRADSDSLIVSSQYYRKPAENHYMVFNYLDEDGHYARQRVFNHRGADITEKLNLSENPAKRILVFVNGYRPTSIGHTFEDNFRDIRANGLEFPESSNYIYNFDRFDYWRPWQQIDLQFQSRINASETFYADGHFSVSTSNHRSLLNFTTVSSIYPKRCADPSHHTCQMVRAKGTRWFGSSLRPAGDLLPLKPNKNGFNLRRANGTTAGKNLLQMLNELPNKSDNDTLFIVAHSMGYAYALGMIDELRGKINFGELYIIAPENAVSGKVIPEEWQQIWQYGCNHQRHLKNAPCMLDGVAPQSEVQGLRRRQRIFIPEEHYRRHGFFDSHFIGSYTWIFNIEPHQAGYIPQR
jgi:hypothetical protein